MTLPTDYARCSTQACPRRSNCARGTTPTTKRLYSISAFKAHTAAEPCPQFIPDVPDDTEPAQQQEAA